MKEVAIIGGGYYGCHAALALKEAGFNVTILEANEDIFCELSGKFGIRDHAGPHYQRSKQTRESCHSGSTEYKSTYPALLIKNSEAIYALGTTDADGLPSKVDQATFESVCKEFNFLGAIDVNKAGYQNLISAYDIDESCIAVGKRLRETFRSYLQKAKVNIIYGARVDKVEKIGNKFSVISANNNYNHFDHVINATSYQSLLPAPEDLPLDIEVVYQPCLALTYEDSQYTPLPFSMIVLDGWFPCIMPVNDQLGDNEKTRRKYIVTHGKYTIAGSFRTPEAAKEFLKKVEANPDSEFIKNYVRYNTELEMNRFWPEFEKRFKYCGLKGGVVAKIKTKREFRSAVTFRINDVIQIIPGKVSNIFAVAREITQLIKNENIIRKGNCEYTADGELARSAHEIIEKPTAADIARNTCELQPQLEYNNRAENVAKNIVCHLYPGFGKITSKSTSKEPKFKKFTTSNM